MTQSAETPQLKPVPPTHNHGDEEAPTIVAFQRLLVQKHRDDEPRVITLDELALLDLSYSGDTSLCPNVRVADDSHWRDGELLVISFTTIDGTAWHLRGALEGHGGHGFDGHVGFRPVCWDWWYRSADGWAPRPDEYNLASPLVIDVGSPTLVEILIPTTTVRATMRSADEPVEKVAKEFVEYLLAGSGLNPLTAKWRHLFIR